MSATEKKIFRNPEIVHRIIDDEAVLVDPGHGTVTVLNRTGSRIWELLSGTSDLARIASAISSEFDIDPGTAKTDTASFIENLMKDGLVNERLPEHSEKNF